MQANSVPEGIGVVPFRVKFLGNPVNVLTLEWLAVPKQDELAGNPPSYSR